MAYDNKTWLSHSGIDVLYRCPRCFWLKYNRKIYQPEGIVSRLPGRFDMVIKKYFDKFRAEGTLPPIVEEKIEGRLENPFQEKYFYSVNEKYGFWGKLDECLINDKNEYIPVDFKTSSSDPVGKEIFPAYQNQMNNYALLLEANRKKTSSFGYLIFFYPKDSDELHNGFPMAAHIQKVKTNPKEALQKIEEAIKVLDGKIPESSQECPFCAWKKVIDTTLKEL